MRFTRTEKLLLGLSVWGILILLLLSYVDFSGRWGATGPTFAIVVPEGDDVRQRSENAYDWRTLGRVFEVAENSRVFTGRGSRARVDFIDGGQLQLQEQTLVVLSQDARRSRIVDVQQGLLYMDLTGGDVFVRVGGKVEKISGQKGRIRLERKGDDVTVSLIEGKVRVGDRPLEGGQFSLKSRREMEPLFRVVGPADGQVVWTETDRADLSLAWARRKPGPSVVILKSLPDGAEIRRETAADGLVALKDLPIGDYQWELRDPATEDAPQTARFRLRPLAPPEILSVKSFDGTMKIAWKDPSISEAYRLDVIDQGGEGKSLFSAEMKDSALQTPLLPQGTYGIRVTSEHRTRPVRALVSRLFTHFHDSHLAPAGERPQLSEKSFKIELTWPGAGAPTPGFQSEEQASFDWKGFATDYSVQIASDYSFEKIVDGFDAFGNSARWTRAREGQWFVRIRPKRDVDGEGWTEPSSLRVIFAAPVIRQGVRDEGTPNLRVVWESHPRVRRFEVAAADNAEFLNARRFVVDEPMMAIPTQGRDPMHVRVRGLAAGGWPVTRYSDPLVSQPKTPRPRVRALARAEPRQDPPRPESQISAQIEQPLRNAFRRFARFWTGLGLNYFRLGQEDQGALAEATFSNFTGPTLMAEVSFVFKEFYQILIGYHDQPGRIDNEQFGLSQTNSRWQTVMVDVSGRATSFDIFGIPAEVSWKAGLQRHRFPFLYAKDGDEVGQALNDVDNIAAGLEVEVPLSARWSAESFMRYQIPIAAATSAGSISYQPGLSFDGSVGFVRRLSRNMRMGLFWFGQSQNMAYSYNDGETATVGKQSFFNSNLQFRLGYDFFSPMGLFLWRRRRRRKENE